MELSKTPKPAKPVLFEIVTSQMQDLLVRELLWLNYAFGIAQKLIKKDVNNRAKKYPGVLIGGGEYRNLLPDEQLKNFCFIYLDDPEEVKTEGRQILKIKTKFSIVFWLNLASIFEEETLRSPRVIELQILKVLTGKAFFPDGRITIDKTYRDAKNIYSEFDISEVDTQFLMQPFTGFRFEGSMEYLGDNFCNVPFDLETFKILD